MDVVLSTLNKEVKSVTDMLALTTNGHCHDQQQWKQQHVQEQQQMQCSPPAVEATATPQTGSMDTSQALLPPSSNDVPQQIVVTSKVKGGKEVEGDSPTLPEKKNSTSSRHRSGRSSSNGSKKDKDKMVKRKASRDGKHKKRRHHRSSKEEGADVEGTTKSATKDGEVLEEDAAARRERRRRRRKQRHKKSKKSNDEIDTETDPEILAKRRELLLLSMGVKKQPEDPPCFAASDHARLDQNPVFQANMKRHPQQQMSPLLASGASLGGDSGSSSQGSSMMMHDTATTADPTSRQLPPVAGAAGRMVDASTTTPVAADALAAVPVMGAGIPDPSGEDDEYDQFVEF